MIPPKPIPDVMDHKGLDGEKENLTYQQFWNKCVPLHPSEVVGNFHTINLNVSVTSTVFGVNFLCEVTQISVLVILGFHVL